MSKPEYIDDPPVSEQTKAELVIEFLRHCDKLDPQERERIWLYIKLLTTLHLIVKNHLRDGL